MASAYLTALFWGEVDTSGGPDACWPWAGALGANGGYGRFRPDRGVEFRAHVFAYEHANGEVPKGKVVCHSCDNPPCCNPKHLFAGTHGDNVADKVAKGRQRRGMTSPGAKLTDERVREIRQRYVARHPANGAAAMAREFGVDRSVVSEIVNFKRWSHVN